jgi:putative DNA primase/helicase
MEIFKVKMGITLQTKIENLKKTLTMDYVLLKYNVKKGNVKNSYYCPFHDDKNPSFVASNEKGWKCLSGCGHGDQITFIQKFDNLDFEDAFKKAASIANFELEDEKIKIVNQLQKKHIEYLNERGITFKTANFYGLKSRGDYILFPQQRKKEVTGYKGINFKTKKMFFEGTDNKSKLYPNSDFNKINTLIFTAGEYDCLLLIQKLSQSNLDGFKAISNSTGENNIKEVLKSKFNGNLIKIFYDNDDAGKKGSEKLAKAIYDLNIPIEIFSFPDDNPKGYDITDFFKEGKTIDDLFKLNKIVFKLKEAEKTIFDDRISIDKFKFKVPKDYFISAYGVTKVTFNYKGEPKEENISNQPVLITNKAINTDEKLIKVELVFKVSGIWEKIQVEREIISDSKKIVSLSNYGFPVHSGNAKKLVEYLHAFENENDNFLDTVYLTHNNGWKQHNDKEIFCLGKNIIGLDSSAKIAFSPELGFERFTKALNTNGSYEKWKEVIKSVIKHNKLSFALYASLAAPLLSLLDAPSFLVHYWGDSSMGKTTALEVAASVWGNPAKESNGLVTSWNNTQVFVERIATFFDDLPLFLDDSQTADDKVISNIVYMVANGTGKGRGSKISGVKHTDSWQTVCFSTGEKQLTESTQYDGAKARTIELSGSPFGRNEGKLVNDVKSGIRENYGFAGSIFISYLLEISNNSDKLQDLKEAYKTYRDELSKHSKNEIGNRIAHYFATVWLSAFLAEDILGIKSNYTEMIETMYLETISERHNEGDISTRALRDVISFAQANMKSFIGKSNDSTREHFGVWRDAEYIAFYPHKLKDFLGKNGFGYTSILKSWSDRDWIKNVKGKMTYPIWHENICHKMVVLKWESISVIE